MQVFVVPGSSPAFLGMQDIDKLGVLTINYKTIGMKLASDNSMDNRKRNCQYERAVQMEDRIPESCTNKRQDAEAQNQHNANNTAEPSVISNPMVMGNNYNENSFPSELKILI